MGKYSVKEIGDKSIWERFVISKDPKSFLNSWNWGETNRLSGKKIFRFGVYETNKLVGVCLIIKESAKRGPHFVIPGGPLINWKNKSVVQYLLNVIKDFAKQEKVWFIRIRPELLDNIDNREMFRDLGFISSPMHLHAENTWVLDISKPEEELFAGMRKSTRYLIRKSMKMDLDVYSYTDPEKSEVLTRLQAETVKRHKFKGFSEDIFKAQLQTFGPDGQAKLYICQKGKDDLAAAIIIYYGKYAYYHHSGSISSFRDIPFSYFLQWKIIQDAKERDMKYYNFWGIAPNDNPKHRFAGVTLFKKGFGGNRIDWLHAQDLPISYLYYLTYVFESFRRILRRL